MTLPASRRFQWTTLISRKAFATNQRQMSRFRRMMAHISEIENSPSFAVAPPHRKHGRVGKGSEGRRELCASGRQGRDKRCCQKAGCASQKRSDEEYRGSDLLGTRPRLSRAGIGGAPIRTPTRKRRCWSSITSSTSFPIFMSRTKRRQWIFAPSVSLREIFESVKSPVIPWGGAMQEAADVDAREPPPVRPQQATLPRAVQFSLR